MLTARGIVVSFGALSVLHDVDLVAGAQDKIAVVGPNGVGKSTLAWGERVLVGGDNGAGKTTLLEALLGQIPLTSGRRSLGASVRVGSLNQARSHLRRSFDGARCVSRRIQAWRSLMRGRYWRSSGSARTTSGGGPREGGGPRRAARRGGQRIAWTHGITYARDRRLGSRRLS